MSASAARAGLTVLAWRITGKRVDADGTVHLLDAMSFGHSPEQAMFRYVTILQPLQARPLDGKPPVMFDLDELTAEPIR